MTESVQCAWESPIVFSKHIRIDASAAVSYYYFSQNYDTFREWIGDELIPDPEFLRLVIPRIAVMGAMNQQLTQTLRQVSGG